MANYFKNTELAAQHNVSEATVRNWIKASQKGRLQLELVTHNGRVYVANSVGNISTIENQVHKNRKYRNSLSAKNVTPSPEFSRIYSETQAYDIAHSLEVYREIPVQYNYFNVGANVWDDNCKIQLSSDSPSTLRQTISLLDDNYEHIEKYMSRFDKLNVIDIGVGNAMPIRALLKRLIERGKLNRYIALDFSDDMTAMAERNLKDWFGEDFPFEGRHLDIVHERFADVIAEGYLRAQGDLGNLVLFLGSTPMSFRAPEDALRTIRESLGPQDLFVYTGKLASSRTLPEWLEFKYGSDTDRNRLDWVSNNKFVFDGAKIKDSFYFILDKLNVDETFYTVEIGIDSVSRQRYAKARLKYALTIRFKFIDGERAVCFEKGEEIIIWRRWETTSRHLLDMLDSTGFYILHSNQTTDRNYILTIAEPQRD
jgi:hypothetical protein